MRRIAGILTVSLLAGCASGDGGSAAPLATPAPSPSASGSASALPSAAESSAAASQSAPRSSAPRSSSAPAATVAFTFPIEGHASYGKTHAGYQATDIFAACGLPVVAVTDGQILEVNKVDTFDPANPRGADKGGLSVSLLGADGVRYYGSHLTRVEPGIEAGVQVKRGRKLGTVGRTGNASNTCHLHFGISPACARTGDWWVRRGVLYPWKYLDAWKAGRSLSPVPEIEGWRARNGCPGTPPPGA